MEEAESRLSIYEGKPSSLERELDETKEAKKSLHTDLVAEKLAIKQLDKSL